MSPAARRLAGPELASAHTLFCVDTAVLFGGPQKRMFRLARGWAARGHPTAVLALRGDEASAPRELESFGLPVYQLTAGGKEVLKSHRVDVARDLRAFTREAGFRLVFSMESLVDYQVRLAHLGRPLPVVTLLGIDRWKWESRPHRVQLVRWLAGHRGAVVGNSQRCLDGWRRVLGERRFARTPSAVLLNPVDPEELTPLFERGERASLVVGGIGRFAPQKGFDLLVDAFARLPAAVQGRPVRLRLQGHGPDEARLRAQIAALGIAERAELVPFSDAIEPFFHSLDCLVVPSRWAGLENVALEGILAGTPTLCTRETGLDAIPNDGSLLFAAADGQAIARELSALLARPAAERAELARRQRELVVRELDLHTVARRLEVFLEGCGLLTRDGSTGRGNP
jgi:glycosyltransferase involved in cell wall biosynthesis